jgi:amino acid adenylation domain-containing protein
VTQSLFLRRRRRQTVPRFTPAGRQPAPVAARPVRSDYRSPGRAALPWLKTAAAAVRRTNRQERVLQTLSSRDDDDLLQLPYDRLKAAGQEAPVVRESPGFEHPGISRRLGQLNEAARLDVCAAACCAVLYRYTGQARIAVTVRSATASTGGPSARRVAVPADGQSTIGSLAGEIAKQLSAAQAEDAAETGVRVTVGRAPYHAAASDGPASPDFELDFTFRETNGRWRIAVDYDARLFDATTAVRMERHLKSCLLAALNDPAVPLASLQLFGPPERRWFESISAGPLKPASSVHVHAEFEKHARRRPQAVAVRFNGSSMSYRELDHAANRLAHYLLRNGAGPNRRVVVCLEPSMDVVVSLLAIFKAGATYVPMNPAFPRHRIDTVLEDTEPVLILTSSSLGTLFTAFEDRTHVIDLLRDDLAGLSPERPAASVDPGQVAYVFYTSGTTGKPKGSRATYANLAHMISVSREAYGLNAADVMPAVASFTFSISMFELMSPLSAGGTLCILERAHVLDPERMARTLGELSVAHIGPGLLKKIVAHILDEGIGLQDFSGLRHISSGGDMVQPELLRQMREIFVAAEIYVIYGCSEISLMGCTWRVDDKPSIDKTYVGKPFSNVRLALLDDDGNRVPVGAVGNVCFAGGGVVDSYLNRPELTDRLFFERDGQRYYSTGDRGRLNTAGDLELLGRRDFQVQIRGMRVELGEIEYHLRQAEGVREGVVASRRRWDGETVVVGYFVADVPGAVDVTELRRHMFSRLPDYMVPTCFVELGALPLNANMKVDRRALPDPEPSSAGREPPSTPTERTLARIWRDLLKVSEVGRDDNFMLRGGDSLLAMQLIHTVQAQLGVNLDGLEILRESLQVLAAICDRARQAGEGDGVLPPPAVRPPSSRRMTRRADSFYFGEGGRLYGVLHQPAGAAAAGSAVLVCAPLAQEYVCCHFLLRTLADSLAEEGVPVMRFDYLGTGDSLGDDLQGSPTRWLADIAEAYERLKSETGNGIVSVLGARLGAAMALRALAGKAVHRWVLWDPVTSGRDHLREQRRMHRQKIDKLLVIRNLRRPRPAAGGEEILGFTYSETALCELDALTLGFADVPQPGDVRQIFTRDAAETGSKTGEWLRATAASPGVFLSDDCRWYDSTQMTTAITHKNVATALREQLRGDGP